MIEMFIMWVEYLIKIKPFLSRIFKKLKSVFTFKELNKSMKYTFDVFRRQKESVKLFIDGNPTVF
ncbi:hypothetical protein BFR04_14545 [Gaetbulibacter sp. 4G1]|nr:hypothetical protein BFR04_14545 [Gaetbulibacter sp. 4G1]